MAVLTKITTIVSLLSVLLTRLTRVVADSGAGSTIETFRNSELIDAIFKNFALKFNEHSCIKALAKKCENKHRFQKLFCAFASLENYVC